MPIPYSANLLKNPTATNDLADWDNISNVTAVDGGVDDGDKCFRFEPTASMDQNVPIGGLPPDIRFQGYFLPGQDIQGSAAVRSEIVVTLYYGDGSRGRYVIPGKTYIGGGW